MWITKARTKIQSIFCSHFLKGMTILAFYVAATSAPAWAQDADAPDSIKLAYVVSPLIGTNLSMAVECFVFVDADSIQVVQFAWKWNNPSLELDSVKASPQFESMEVGPFFFLGDDISISNDSQVALCAGICTINCYPAAAGWRHLATYYMHSSGWTAGSAVNIDTVQIPGHYLQSTEYLFLPLSGIEYDPVWSGSINFAGCCVGIRGDMNLDGDDANIVDLNYLVNKIFRRGPLPGCPKEADINSDGASANIVDLNYLVNKIFRNGPAPGACG
jgi:hypothetical protein